MAGLSLKDTSLAGLQLARERPAAIVVWALFRLFAGLLPVVIMIPWVGAKIHRVTEMQVQMQAIQEAGGRPDVAFLQEYTGISMQVLPASLLSMILALVFFAILSAAVYRAVLKPGDSAFGYLRLGAAELRQLVVSFVISLLAGLIAVAGGVAVALLGAALMGGPESSGRMVFRIVGFCIVGAGVFLFLVRLSLAGPQTMATGQINIFGSWSLAGERYWQIVGISALALIQGAVAVAIASAIIVGAGAVMGIEMRDAMKVMGQPDMSSFATFFTPLGLLWVILGPIATTLAMTAVLAPAVPVYLQRQAEESMDDMDDD